MSTATTADKPQRGTKIGLITGLGLVLALTAFGGEAEGVRRACRATGSYLFSFQEEIDGSLVARRSLGVDILQSDMEVVASGYQNGGRVQDINRAKRFACSEATQCFLAVSSSDGSCSANYYGTTFETITRPPHIDRWRREVACNAARAGRVPNLRQTGANRVLLAETRIEAVASRDSVTDRRYRRIVERHVCWEANPLDPDGVGHPLPQPPPRPTAPPPASSDLAVPFQITGGSLRVSPSHRTGPCPMQIRVTAELTAVGSGTARFRLSHKGGSGPVRTVTFPRGGTRRSTASYSIGVPSSGGPAGEMAAPGGSGSSGSGGLGSLQQATVPGQHTGFFELEIVSPNSPLARTAPAHYSIVCESEGPADPVQGHLVPGATGGGRERSPSGPGAGSDLYLISATAGRDGSCDLVVGNRTKQPAPASSLRLSTRGRPPIDVLVPPVPGEGRQTVSVEGLGELRWQVELDRLGAIAESDEANNRQWIHHCRRVER